MNAKAEPVEDEFEEEWEVKILESGEESEAESPTSDTGSLSKKEDDERISKLVLPETNFIDHSKEDKSDDVKITKMYGNDSTEANICCNKHCNKKIPKELALRHRFGIQEMTKSEKDLVITAQLQAHRRIKQLLPHYGKETKRKKTRLKESNTLLRLDMRYFFYDLHVCKKMYCFLNDLGKDHLEGICKHLDKNGLTLRVHKLTQKPPNRKNVLQPRDIQKTVSFLQSYGREFGLHVANKLPQFRDFSVVRLPPQHTKTFVYRKYFESLSTDDKRIARTTFCKIWKKYCPYIAVARPTNNVCNKVMHS